MKFETKQLSDGKLTTQMIDQYKSDGFLYPINILEIEEASILRNELELIEENDPICICYPYGSYNDNTLRILNEINADIGFTTKVGASKIDKKTCDVNFLLERWDTNDCWDSEFRKPILPRL